MKFNKSLNRSGGITLPSALRRAYGLSAGEKFSVSVDGEGSIVLKRIEGNCLFCGADKHLIRHRGRFVCVQCIRDMVQMVEG
ncbi:AbrB/MazE/SpoVT family DNA-binding domain-containing protein [Paenibacillus lentus]|uniref:AbrB/MazE/SpoVT family DNA-binding domain-containing protein n=1 Tax=Paenibacillus lentus TaxID=1338368 RepID=UPI00364DB4DC